MNPFDAGILRFLNSFAGHSETFDEFVVLVSSNMLIKGAIFAFLFWWAWFRRSGGDQTRRREILLTGYIASIFGVVLARITAHIVPFRERPLRVPELHMSIPDYFHRSALHDWSAFPSDHAVLFFALSTTIFLVWHRAGILAFLYSATVISLPRLYLGLHHPTDIIAGAALGIFVALFAARDPLRTLVARPALQQMEANPGPFYGALFFLSYMIGTVCEPILDISAFARTFMNAVVRRLGLGSGVTATSQSILEPAIITVTLFALVALAYVSSRRAQRHKRLQISSAPHAGSSEILPRKSM